MSVMAVPAASKDGSESDAGGRNDAEYQQLQEQQKDQRKQQERHRFRRQRRRRSKWRQSKGFFSLDFVSSSSSCGIPGSRPFSGFDYRRLLASAVQVMLLLLLLPSYSRPVWSLSSSSSSSGDNEKRQTASAAPVPAAMTMRHPKSFDYDLVIVGGGAAGLFALGAATSLLGRSKRIALIDASDLLGGDCTNAACVPSKALRSAAAAATLNSAAAAPAFFCDDQSSVLRKTMSSPSSIAAMVRQHVIQAVSAVRQRENPDGVRQRYPNVDLYLNTTCHFVSPHQICLVKPTSTTNNITSCDDDDDDSRNKNDDQKIGTRNSTKLVAASTNTKSTGTATESKEVTPTARIINSRRFLITIGAAPVVRQDWMAQAKMAGISVSTYRSFLKPPLSSQQQQNSVSFQEEEKDTIAFAGSSSDGNSHISIEKGDGIEEDPIWRLLYEQSSFSEAPPVKTTENDAERSIIPLSTPNGLSSSLADSTNQTFQEQQQIQQQEQQQQNTQKRRRRRIVIVGGGPTACELGQALGRVIESQQRQQQNSQQSDSSSCSKIYVDVELIWVAPGILPQNDERMQQAALQILLGRRTAQTSASSSSSSSGSVSSLLSSSSILDARARVQGGITQLHLGKRLAKILPQNRTLQLDNGDTIENVDAILVCTGRSPSESLRTLQLDQAGVVQSRKENAENFEKGIPVNARLQSNVPHIYAAGDCAKGVAPRSSGLAAWTGFHAIRNMVVPHWLLLWRGARSIHPAVPRVIYMEPELACVGMDYSECVTQFGRKGFRSLCLPEEGSDRADMERNQRGYPSVCFVELRVHRFSGRILGGTACGPAAAELVNSIGMAITNKLTVEDVARSIHSYPSHGYLLYRAALAMALSTNLGLLEACGPVGCFFAKIARFVVVKLSNLRQIVRRLLPHQRLEKKLREWEGEGARKVVYHDDEHCSSLLTLKAGTNVQVTSFLDIHTNDGNGNNASSVGDDYNNTRLVMQNDSGYIEWLRRRPR